MKFYYSFGENTPLGKKMDVLFERMEKVDKIAEAFAQNAGAESYIENLCGLSGGVEKVITSSKVMFLPNWRPFEWEGIDTDQRAWEPDVTDDELERLMRDAHDRTNIARLDKFIKGSVNIPYYSKWQAFTAIMSGILKRMSARIQRAFISLRLWWRDVIDPYTDAMCVERQRQELPIVSLEELLQILEPVPVKDKNGKVRNIIVRETPSFFCYQKRWYFEVSFTCSAEGLELNTEKTFFRKRMAAINMQEYADNEMLPAE